MIDVIKLVVIKINYYLLCPFVDWKQISWTNSEIK